MPDNRSSAKSSSTTQVPSIRTFQMDSSSQGNLSSAVNLFRGDVNLTQNLFTLPGRSQGNGLDVSVSIQYQSNVFHDATTWNAEAPTGILGLGWSFPLTYIESLTGTSPVPNTRQYVFYDNGSPNPLIQQPIVPLVFAMEGDLSIQLQDGNNIPADVLRGFLGNGLLVSAQATIKVSATDASSWILEDDDNQQLFTLRQEGSSLNVYDGGIFYQLQNYQFWKILYYPLYERWLIVSDQGMRRSFGGQTGDGTAKGNSISWSVWWADNDGHPIWTGASSDTLNQVQVARAWYLCEVADRFGSKTEYDYTTVEQQVGTGGKPYTKAVYLNQIQDVFGRTVQFNYGDKLWDAEPESPREYYDPHRTTPSDAPGPFQDRYETLYLETIEVSDPSGNSMFSIDFEYQPEAGSSVANITDNTGTLKGDTYKRFLTGFVSRNQDGVASPGMQFTYDLNLNTPNGQPGALLSVTAPTGGITNYKYEKQDLLICDRTLQAPLSTEVPDGSIPRVFFGNDYVVLIYYHQSSTTVYLQIYTWSGSWLKWQLDESSPILDTNGGFDLDELQVMAQSDFVAVSLPRPSGDLDVYVFQRDPARVGQWLAAEINGTTTAKDQPTLSYSNTGEVTFVGGSNFFVVRKVNQSYQSSSGSYDLVTWRWPTQSWDIEQRDVDRYFWITASNEYYAVVDRNWDFSLNYLDGTLTWQTIDSITLPNTSETISVGDLEIVPGDGLVVVAHQSIGASTYNQYQLWIIEWNCEYTCAISEFGDYQDNFGDDEVPLSWTPQIIEDTLIAINGNLIRRSGSVWSDNTNLNLSNPSTTTGQRYAYGSDFAIQIVFPTTGTTTTAKVIAYDPVQAAWTVPVDLGEAMPGQDKNYDNWPSVNGDWVVVGPYVYYRGTETNWSVVLGGACLTDLAEISDSDTYNSESLVNQAPSFFAYTIGKDSDKSVQSLMIKNGNLDPNIIDFSDETLYFASDSTSVVGAGVSPNGPSLFVSYPSTDSNFNDASTIYLHRYAGYDVDGPITHYTVTQVEMSNGFEESTSTFFEPDLATAGADPSGNVVKFYKSTTYPGATSTDSDLNGKTVNYYLNGLQELTGTNYYNMLDGLQLRTEQYEQGGDVPLESQETAYTVLQQVASSPTDSNAPTIQLRGGWVTQTQQVKLKNGVTTITTTEYVPANIDLPYSGALTQQSVTFYGSSGKQETFCQTKIYGVEIEPKLVAIHALADIAQLQKVWFEVENPSDTVAISAEATTYQSWPSALADVLVPEVEATFAMVGTNNPVFPYDEYSPGDIPNGWQLDTRTTDRTLYGQEIESVDALGLFMTTIFDRNYELAIAQISNASRDACAYCGFQDYEDLELLSGLQTHMLDGRNPYTGHRSAKLATNETIELTVTPTTETYLVGCRYLTSSDFVPDSSGLSVTINGTTQSISLAWENTEDQWKYVTLPIPLTEATSSITVTASNTTEEDVHLDTLLVVPLINGSTIRTFDPDSQQILSTMDASGRISRTYYDRNYRPTVAVDASGFVKEISMRFKSRQGNTENQFDPASPNAELTLHSAGGGILETFRDGVAWASRWSASDPDNWQVSDGSLQHNASTSGSITWNGDPGENTYALYFEPQTEDTSEINVTVGDIAISWSAASSYRGGPSGTDWTALATPPKIAQHWLLVIGDGVVLFFGDGQLLFSEQVRPSGTSVNVTVSGGSTTLRNLTVVEQIRLGLTYNDAAGRQRQAHQLYGTDSYIAQVVYDSLGRKLASTKSAPGSLGSSAVMQYQTEFLDVSAFLTQTSSPTSPWLMTGTIADYYDGTEKSGYTPPNDEGYPYWGVRYEASARALPVEMSQPGKDYAIDLSCPSDERQTLQFARGWTASATPSPSSTSDKVAESSVANVSENERYYENSITSAVKTVSKRIADALGQTVSNVYLNSDSTVLTQSSGVYSYDESLTGPTTSVLQQQPNALNDGPQDENSNYIKQTTANALQETTSLWEPDTDETQFIFDATGNLRFVQPTLENGQTWFTYYKYDAIGRMIEEGTVEDAWDTETLKSKADDISYPSDGRIAVLTEYDGDGTNPDKLGLKYRTTTYNPTPDAADNAGDCTVVETFEYDTSGNMIAVTQVVAGAASLTQAVEATISYSYNALNEVLSVGMPDGAPIETVFYTYDDQGNIIAVGTTEQESDLGSFTYTPEHQVATQTNGNWQRTFEYATTGAITQLTTVCSGGDQNVIFQMSYEPDGKMASRRVELSGEIVYEDNFTHDAKRRLQSAIGHSNIEEIIYDPSGNLWETTSTSGDLSTFSCTSGKNQLNTVQLEGGSSVAIIYDSQGRMTSGLDRTFEYDNATGMTTSITSPNAQLRLAYGSAQQRVLKQIVEGSSEQRIYYSGAGQIPVATLVGTYETAEWTVQVHGPTGLLAYISDQTYFPVTDPTGSIWAVVTDIGVEGTSTYLPFGQIANITGNPEIIPYRYQGQEWDAEVELYNFRRRMYDPVLCRFLTPDLRRQFSSPYVFAGNDPLTITDPTGEISTGGQVGIGIGMAAITILGIALAVPTGGTSVAAVAEADAAVGSSVAASAAATAGVEAATAGVEAATAGVEAATAGVEVAAEATAVGAEATSIAGTTSAAEVTAGATTQELKSSLKRIGQGGLSNAMSSAGIEGLKYDIQHGRDFTTQGFLQAFGIGAAGGFITGAMGEGLNVLITDKAWMNNSSIGARITKRTITGIVPSIIGNDVSTILTNVSQHDPWYQGLLKSTIGGATSDILFGDITGACSSKMKILHKALSKNVISCFTETKNLTAPQRFKATVNVMDIAEYAINDFFIPNGFLPAPRPR